MQDLHFSSKKPGGSCWSLCLPSLPVPRGTRGLCWTRAAAGVLRKIVFQHRLKAVVAHYVAESVFAGRQGRLFQIGFDCVTLTSPCKFFACKVLVFVTAVCLLPLSAVPVSLSRVPEKGAWCQPVREALLLFSASLQNQNKVASFLALLVWASWPISRSI